jgi:voltage-gated potassium channel
MLRKRISLEIDPEMRTQKGLSQTNTAIIYLICLSIFVGVLETEQTLTVKFQSLFLFSQAFLFLVFTAEYLARIYAAPENPKYPTPLHYMVTFAAIVDLAVVLSFLLPIFGLEAAILRIFRATRLVRLARLGRYSVAMQVIASAIHQRRYELGFSIVLAFALMLLSSTALYLAERGSQPEDFGSIPRAMWWSIATLTTVGYGDVVPVTFLGRAAAAVTALTGIGLIALPTGILAGAFGEALRDIKTATDKTAR